MSHSLPADPSLPAGGAASDSDALPRAIVYCEGNFGQIDGKTANGLVRSSARYEILSVIDSLCAGQDTGMVLDGRANGIPVRRDLRDALCSRADRRPSSSSSAWRPRAGCSPSPSAPLCWRRWATGLGIVNGLHEFLNDDPEFCRCRGDQRRRDPRRPPAPADRRAAHVQRQHPRRHLPADRRAGNRRGDRQAHDRHDPDPRAERARREGGDGRDRPDQRDPGRPPRGGARCGPGAVRHRRARSDRGRGLRRPTIPT